MKIPIIFILSCLILSALASGQSKKAKAKFDKGVAQNKAGILVDATMLFTEAIDEYPDYADAYYQRALSFNGMEQKPKAIRDLEKSIDLKIQNIQAYLLLIRWYKSDGAFDQALAVTKKIIKQLPDNAAGAYYDQGLIYDKIKEPRKALIAYKSALVHLDPEMVDFQRLLEKRIKDIEAEL